MHGLLLALSLAGARGLAFCPSDRRHAMWDTWLYRGPQGWLLNYLTRYDDGQLPPGVGTGSWNGVSSALSADGAHWADLGVVIAKDCKSKADCANWLGSGSVWKKLGAGDGDGDGDGGEYVMNYSQERYDCEAPSGWCQSIFFATSRDLISWTPLAPDALEHGGPVFKYPDAGYEVGGRWDCIAVLPRASGGYWGYFTATPTPGANSSAYCGGGHCGAGFGVSTDGVAWRALPTPGPAAPGEVGGVAQLGGKTFMTFGGGMLYEAAGPEGPFAPSARNHRFLTQEGRLAFARLWGALYTRDESLVLVTHQQVNRRSIYAGLVKRAVLGTDGVLRAVWWEANDALRAAPLPTSAATVTPPPLAPALTTACVGACLSSGLWVEGTIDVGADAAATASGVWFQLEGGEWADGFGFALAAADAKGGTPFLLGPARADGNWTQRPLAIDRSLAFGGGGLKSVKSVAWRAIARNSYSAEGMVEFYVDGVLSLPFTLPAAITGVFGAFGAAEVGAVHGLSLPTQEPAPAGASPVYPVPEIGVA